jgi:site-specific DNA-methyltransferase (adenine-specific)
MLGLQTKHLHNGKLMSTQVRKRKSEQDLAFDIEAAISEALDRDGIALLPPQDAKRTLALVGQLGYHFDTAMIDPWYNKGFGGMQDDYLPFFLDVIRQSGEVADHVYFWGFPEIVAPFVERVPKPLELVCWLTWYYKNNPSVIRGWRSSQNACLHMSHPGAALHPERFLNEKQLALKEKGKLRYMPGPTSVLEGAPADVIEQALLVGFVGRKEQTGHPSQKPFKVYDQLLQMTVSDAGQIVDPMCGSGTTGAVAKERGFRTILCDGSEEYTKLVENRLGVKRLKIGGQIDRLLTGENR